MRFRTFLANHLCSALALIGVPVFRLFIYCLAMISSGTGFDTPVAKMVFEDAFPVFLTIWLIAVVIGVYIDKKVPKWQAEQEEREKDEQAKEFYLACQERQFADTASREFLMLAKSHGIEDADKARTMYNRGLKIHEEEIKTQKASELNELIKQTLPKEQKEIEEAKKVSELIGHEKYLAEWRENLETSKALVAGLSTSNVRPKTHDPVLHGAIAEGLAGPGAGAYIAVKTQLENEQAKADYEASKDKRDLVNAIAIGRLAEIGTPEEIQNKIDSFKRQFIVIMDENNEMFSHIHLSDISSEKTVTGNLRVKGRIKQVDEYFLLDKPAFIDGSIYIKVKDGKSGTEIGRGIFNAPAKKGGFRTEGVFELICDTHGKEFDESQAVLIASPLHIWAIETRAIIARYYPEQYQENFSSSS